MCGKGFCCVNVEQVVEEFLKLVSEEKVEQAKDLVVEEAKGREDELARWLLGFGAEVGNNGNHLLAFFCFKVAEEIVISKDIQKRILEGISIIHNNYAVLLQEKKDFENAEYHYKKALKINPEYVGAHNNYANLFKEKKDFENAEYHYKKALKINPEYSKAHNNYAVLLQEKKDFENAEYHYKKALKINPEFADANYNYANLLQEKKDFENAEYHYKKALKINPEYAGAHNNYALLLKEKKDFENAEYHYKKALKINPEYADANYNYANLLQEKKDFENAEYHYKKALKINPEYSKAHNNYALLLKEKKDFENAEYHYKKALKINPEFVEVHGNLGILYSGQKKYSEAIKHFEKASKIFKRKKKSFEYKKTEAFKFLTQAQLFWKNESWQKIQTGLEKAIKNFRECGMDYHTDISNNLLVLVTVDQSFNECLTSQNLSSLRYKISSVYQNILKFKENLEEDIHEYKIFKAKLNCIEILYKALTSTDYNIQNLDEARKTLRKENFIKAVQSVNCLENFVIDLSESLSKYGDIKSIPESEEKTLLTTLNPMQYLDGYTSAGVLQEVQKLEPWQKSQTPIQYIKLNPPAKKWVKLGIVQFNFTLQSKNSTPQFPPTPENPLTLKEKFLQYVDIAIKNELDIVCFPELSMTQEILEIIQEKNIQDMIIIGGSYYINKKNICPVICNNTIHSVQKIHPSKYCQFSPIEGEGMDPGDTIYLFDSAAGKFAVLICEDFRDELFTILSTIDDLDLLFVTSYNPNPDRFHKIAAPIPPNHPMYIIQSNVSEINKKFGKSSLFGNIDFAYAEQLKKEGFNSDIEKNKVAEIENEGMLIGEVNTTQKTISKVTPVDYKTIKNIKIVNKI
jgi:tetratricopeptide (TPR) repeat protein